MTMGRLKCISLALIVGIALFVLPFLACSLYADLSEAVLLSSDISTEDPDDEGLSTCQNEFKVSSNLQSPWTHFVGNPNLIPPPSWVVLQDELVLRC